MLDTRSPASPMRGSDQEEGFTLVEILVVIIIIGILAAVAIPIFLNQQRTARDSATAQDVKNAATGLQTAFASDSSANLFSLGTMNSNDEFVPDSDNTIDAKVTRYAVRAGNGTPVTLTKTEGTVINAMERPNTEGQYIIRGWNEDGREYTNQMHPFLYDSTQGGVTDSPRQTIANGSFEDGFNGWTGEYGPPRAEYLDKGTAYTGTSSLHARDGGGFSLRGDPIKVEAGEVWELSAWVKAEGVRKPGAGFGGIRLQTSTDGGNTWNGTGYQADVLPPTDGWERIHFVYEVPDNVTHLRARVAYSGLLGWEAWTDDVQLAKIK